MYRGMDMNDNYGFSPVLNNKMYLSIVFIGLYIIFAIYFQSFFIGLVVNNYQNIRDSLYKYDKLSEIQKEFFQMQEIFLKKKLLI